MFYSQVILAKKGPLAKVWLAAHWGDKKLGRPQIFATDISQSVESIVNPTVPLALRVSGHLLLGVVRIYSRKVKYVLNDCTEAMLKMQMAFLPRKDLLEQTDSKENKTVTTVANFGEYDQIHIVEGFALPLPDENEWILAEDGDEENDEMMHKLNQQHSSQQRQKQSPQGGDYQPPEEEHWVPFDPDNEDDDDNEHDRSLVSEVEVVRAANDESFLSADQTRRDSSLLPGNKEQQPKPAGEESDNEPADFGDIPFGDDDDDDIMMGPPDTPGAGGNDDSLLNLSLRESDAHNLSAISGLEESPAVADANSKKRPSQVTPRRRRRKRRKVIIDNDETELSTDHIKSMIANTSDIVRRQIHPAEPDEESSTLKKKKQSKNNNKISLTQPFLADDGHLHPALQKLFRDNFYRALDEPCPYKRKQEEGEDEDDVEQVRRDAAGTASDLEDDEQVSTGGGEKAASADNNDNDSSDNEPADFGNDFGGDMMDDEEEDQLPPPEDNMDAPDLDDDEEDVLNHQGQVGELADLGLVNELALDSDDEDEDDENREAIGDQNSNSTKWHKHTVRVLKLLQRKIKAPGEQDDEDDDDDDNNEETQKQTHVQFEDLSHNCTRRTAASVFFELLQLKTWDFVELEQPEPYGDIAVSAGVRFSEQPPNK
mmetsp:Transcript_13392/g.32256  ORF Transcript_13392/g.32256 Transcript_13392/m.32256 type:complete len:655 (+) Transcript_13392:91-2055(+)